MFGGNFTPGGIFSLPNNQSPLPAATLSRYSLFSRPSSEQATLKQSLNQQLAAINNCFLDEHKKAGLRMLAKIKHVVVLSNGTLELWQRNEHVIKYTAIARVETAARNECYTLLKSLAHIPVLIVSILQKAENYHDELTALLGKLQQLAKDLPAVQDYSLNQNVNLIHESIELLQQLLRCPSSKHEIASLVNEYMKHIKNDLDRCGQGATHAQLSSLKAITHEWQSKNQIDWHASRILIVAPHGPRQKLIEQQYFEELYHQLAIANPIDNKIYYVEMLPSQIEKLDVHKDLIEGFLSASEINKIIGSAVFDDEQAMFTDRLADYAPQVLETLKAESGSSRCPLSFKFV